MTNNSCSDKTTLILGGNGQDARILARKLADLEGHRVVSAFSRKLLRPVFENEEYRIVDYFSKEAHWSLLEETQPDSVYFLSGMTNTNLGESLETYSKFNFLPLERTLTWIKMCKPTCRVFHAGSVEIFGDRLGLIDESCDPSPQSPYGYSKAMAHDLMRGAVSDGIFAINSIISNHESIYRSEKFLFGKILKCISEAKRDGKKTLELYGEYIEKDWGYATEFCDTFFNLMSQDEPGTYLIATGQNCTVSDMAKFLLEEAQVNERIDLVFHPSERKFDVQKRCFAPLKLEAKQMRPLINGRELAQSLIRDMELEK